MGVDGTMGVDCVATPGAVPCGDNTFGVVVVVGVPTMPPAPGCDHAHGEVPPPADGKNVVISCALSSAASTACSASGSTSGAPPVSTPVTAPPPPGTWGP